MTRKQLMYLDARAALHAAQSPEAQRLVPPEFRLLCARRAVVMMNRHMEEAE